MTVLDRYPLPNIHNITVGLTGVTIFSKTNLLQACNQILVNSVEVCKAAVITPFGLFEFLRLTFELRNTSQTFRRFIDTVLRGLPFVFSHFEDCLVASSSEKEH